MNSMCDCDAVWCERVPGNLCLNVYLWAPYRGCSTFPVPGTKHKTVPFQFLSDVRTDEMRMRKFSNREKNPCCWFWGICTSSTPFNMRVIFGMPSVGISMCGWMDWWMCASSVWQILCVFGIQKLIQSSSMPGESKHSTSNNKRHLDRPRNTQLL
jgi:hypothetical protein